MRSSRGFSLLEVLITMIILAVGLLGLAGLQARAHNAEAESYSRAQAIILSNDMVDRIAANRVQAKLAAASVYNTTTVQGTGHADVDCSTLPSTSAAEIATKDLCEWDMAIKGATRTSGSSKIGSLNQGRGCIALVTTPIQGFVVTVAWAGREGFGTTPSDRTCASAAIPTSRRLVSVTVPFADLDN
jgi:type IV pilus assembly protein PilV